MGEGANEQTANVLSMRHLTSNKGPKRRHNRPTNWHQVEKLRLECVWPRSKNSTVARVVSRRHRRNRNSTQFIDEIRRCRPGSIGTQARVVDLTGLGHWVCELGWIGSIHDHLWVKFGYQSVSLGGYCRHVVGTYDNLVHNGQTPTALLQLLVVFLRPTNARSLAVSLDNLADCISHTCDYEF